MRVLPFVKYSPCGNTTILIRDTPLVPAARARCAAEIIAPGHLEGEQAGFIDLAAHVPRLDMMGGEFCVNATRAFAVELLREGRLAPEGEGVFFGGGERVRDAGAASGEGQAAGRQPFRVRRAFGPAGGASP